MTKKNKCYVVWIGKSPGIYFNWNDCLAQVHGFPNAKYKSFDTLAEAELAFAKAHNNYIKTSLSIPSNQKPSNDLDLAIGRPIYGLSVDAACSGNPGSLEFRGVWIDTKEELFCEGPFLEGTNNLGEFLGIIKGLQLLGELQHKGPIYTDSMTALSWIRNKKVKTTLRENDLNREVLKRVFEGENWLKEVYKVEHQYQIPIFKWETHLWGEIPADFGRK